MTSWAPKPRLAPTMRMEDMVGGVRVMVAVMVRVRVTMVQQELEIVMSQ